MSIPDPDAGVEGPKADLRSDQRLARLSMKRGVLVGASQIFALLPGISRSGVAMVAGLTQGLSHRDAARFSFLLATPVILAAGVLKIPDLTGPLGAGITGQILVGSAASFVCAYLSVRFLERYFRTRTLIPFAIYSLIVGAAALIWLSVRLSPSLRNWSRSTEHHRGLDRSLCQHPHCPRIRQGYVAFGEAVG